jgi:hypothetical protein
VWHNGTPKIANLILKDGMHDPYIMREFHGVWGNFDVNITIDKEFVRRYGLFTKSSK